MHLTVQSRQVVGTFCAEKVFHHLLVEFDCDETSVEDNVRETAEFYRNFDKQMNWNYLCREKIKKYSSIFEPCSMPHEGPLITLNNSENPILHSVTARGVQGILPTMILGVLSIPVRKHQIYYFSRHGESEFNVLGRIGGDADLSARGQRYADRLTKYLTSPNVVKPKTILTSELIRTIHTAQNIPGDRTSVKELNEINAVSRKLLFTKNLFLKINQFHYKFLSQGICEGLTYEEIHERFPQEFAWRDQDKLKYRYPHGESYLDLLQRVDCVVQAILLQSDALVISHQAVLRCIMAYFKGSKPGKYI